MTEPGTIPFKGNFDTAPLPWYRGTGNDAHKVFDAAGRLVAAVAGDNLQDAALIVKAVNASAVEEAAT